MTRDEELVREIAELQGLRPGRVDPVRGQGSVNRVFVISSDTSRFVVRFPVDPLRRDEFDVETWCLTQADAHGIPSPQVVARGHLRKVPYLIQTFVEGTPATQHPAAESRRTLAAYARVVHTIPLTADAPDGLFSRFGRDLHLAWQAHLTYNRDQLSSDDLLIKLGVYPADLQPRLRSGLTRLGSLEWSYGLRHGDLAPRNLLVPPAGLPVLIDWGSASAGPVPYGDLLPAVKMHRATGQPSTADLHAYAADLGTPLEQVVDIIEDLLLLDALDLVRWAIDQRPDRLGDVVASAQLHIQAMQQR